MKIKKRLSVREGWLGISNEFDFDVYVLEGKEFGVYFSEYDVIVKCDGAQYHVCKCLSLKRAIKKAEKVKKWIEEAAENES